MTAAESKEHSAAVSAERILFAKFWSVLMNDSETVRGLGQGTRYNLHHELWTAWLAAKGLEE